MRTSYRRISDNGATVTTAFTVAPFYGRACAFTLTAYHLCQPDGDTVTAITFGFRVAERAERLPGIGHLPDGMLRISEPHRTLEQELAVRPLCGHVLGMSDITDGGVEAGREIAQAILRKFESVVETTRQSIRRNMGREVRDAALGRLHDRFHEPTRETVTGILGQFNWPLLLDGSNCGEECLGVVEYTMSHNRPTYHDITFDGETGIPTLASESFAFTKLAIADFKATALLEHVCGRELAAEFSNKGRITVKSGGFTFVIRPNKFVECTDPKGNKGVLCIHAASFSCNPIDELTIAYLSIKHRLKEYLKTAVVHGRDPGFSVTTASAA